MTQAERHNQDEARGAAMRRSSARTCAGCGEEATAGDLVRLVLGPGGELAVDLAGGAFGRGAHVHPSPACLTKAAPRGLARSFRAEVRATAPSVARAIVDAADRRVEGLLASASRGGSIAVGADAVTAGLGSGAVELVVVARDAAAAAQLSAVTLAVAQGRAVAWGDRARLGGLARKPEIAVLGITSPSIASAVKAAVTVGSGVSAMSAALEDR